MNCLETQRRIRAFLDHTLTDGELKDFLDHVEHCSACREELDLYCGIEAALEEDEEPGNRTALPEYSGFEEMTDALIQDGRRHLALKRSVKALRYVLSGILAAVLLYVVLEITGVVPAPWGSDDERLVSRISRIMTWNRQELAETESETPREEIDTNSSDAGDSF